MTTDASVQQRIAYFGPEHTNTHAAARRIFGPTSTFVAQPTKTSVFETVAKGSADLGVVPIENSTEGVVRETIDALIQFDVKIVREFEMEIEHFLLCHPDADPGRATRILSHPQPLAQCRNYLLSHYPGLPYDTAVSTASAAEIASREPTTLAIASSLAQEHFGLRSLDGNIADRSDNATRFICIGATDSPPTGRDKTSLVLTTPHEKGALLQVLAVFDAANVNLIRIESRPLAGRRWEYAFVVDVEGHRTEEPLRGALERLNARKALSKVLGSYPQVDSQLAVPVKSSASP